MRYICSFCRRRATLVYSGKKKNQETFISTRFPVLGSSLMSNWLMYTLKCTVILKSHVCLFLAFLYCWHSLIRFPHVANQLSHYSDCRTLRKHCANFIDCRKVSFMWWLNSHVVSFPLSHPKALSTYPQPSKSSLIDVALLEYCYVAKI